MKALVELGEAVSEKRRILGLRQSEVARSLVLGHGDLFRSGKGPAVGCSLIALEYSFPG